MGKDTSTRLIFILGVSAAFLFQSPSQGQPIADPSVGSRVIRQNPELTLIQDGTVIGNNLFHSFSEFSIPEGQTVRFSPDAPRGIQTIFSRVTGNNISHLRGKIQTNRNLNANLVFLNPNGIIFHQNFELDIQGSFLASTAESILFEQGDRFSTQLSQSSPLLKISAPSGLQFGKNPGKITVLTGDHTNPFNTGLRAKNFQDIALMGGDIEVSTGNIIAPGGNIWLGSIQGSGLIRWQDGERWTFDPQPEHQRGNIEINENSSLFSSFNTRVGGVNGLISLFGEQVKIENSALNAENRGRSQGGDILIHATQTLDLIASDPLSIQSSPTLSTQTRARGDGGNIVLSAQNISIISESSLGDIRRIVTDSAGLRADVNPAQLGQPGDIQVTADQRLSLQGGSIITSVSSAAGSSNPSGNITIEARHLDILDGSQIRTSSQSLQPGGILRVEVDENILLSGFLDFIRNSGERTFRPSGFVADANRDNRGGVVDIMTPYLRIENGAAIQSVVPLGGQGGDIRIQTDRLELVNGGQIRASADNEENGTAGNIDVTASISALIRGQLLFADGQTRVSAIQAETTTQDNTIANTGNITLTTPLLLLEDGAEISANSNAIQGGNITLDIGSLLFLNNASRIVSNASRGEGGQILITGFPWIISPLGSGSDITANSEQSSGGQILINSRGVEGFKLNSTAQNTEQLQALGTNDINDIAASSGNPNLQGEVVINQPTNLIQRFIQLEAQVVEANAIEQCHPKPENVSQFQIVGKGGINSPAPANLDTWDDTRTQRPDNPQLSRSRSIPKDQESWSHPLSGSIIQASAWTREQDGRVALIANLPDPHIETQRHASVACRSLM
jgi:filamentous hemagglutinin family protein